MFWQPPKKSFGRAAPQNEEEEEEAVTCVHDDVNGLVISRTRKKHATA